MLNAIHAECRYAECLSAECRGAIRIIFGFGAIATLLGRVEYQLTHKQGDQIGQFLHIRP